MTRQPLRLIWPVLSIAVLVVAAVDALAQQQEDTLSRFKREAPIGWAELEKVEAGLEFGVRVTESRKNAKRPEDREKQYVATWRRRPGCLLLERADVENNQAASRTVIAVNEDYEFKARQSRGEGESWQLKMMRLRKPGDGDSDHFLVYQAYLFPFTSILNSNGLRLSEMMKDPGFQLNGAEAKDGLVHVRVNFLDKTGAHRSTAIRGVIVFDPDLNWAVRGYQLTDGGKINISRKANLAEQGIDMYRPLARITTEYRSSANSSVVDFQRTADFESVKRVASSPDAFRLSAFNLPEPPGLEKPSTRLPWLAGGAALCAGLTLLFWWLARRRNRNALMGN